MNNQGGINNGKVIHKELSFDIVGILFEVYNKLGYGYQEKYYERAIEACLIERKYEYKKHAPHTIEFNGKFIGRYFFDFIIENKIVLEIKMELSFLEYLTLKIYKRNINYNLCNL